MIYFTKKKNQITLLYRKKVTTSGIEVGFFKKLK